MPNRFFILLLTLVLLGAACATNSPTPTPTMAVAEAATAVPTPTPPAPERLPIPTPVDAETETAVAPPFPLAPIINDEGGPVAITGVVSYTNPFFTLGIAQPLIILEDQAGFVDRDEEYLFPLASQTLGQITSDFFTSPFSYSLALPMEPQGGWRDVDNNNQDDQGVQVFAIAYWNNTFGDPFLEERDMGGGGWSTAYASTRVSFAQEKEREIIGGYLLVYAPDDAQGFPSGFGNDGLLFTADDPMITLPQGYTLVNLDTDPFTFDRARYPRIDLLEPEEAALVDYSDLSYGEAFNALVDQLSREYAFTEFKGIDWEALRADFLPRMEKADTNRDALAYRRTLRDFAWAIPDGHIAGPFVQDDFFQNAAGGVGLVMNELSDGRFIVTYLVQNSPATAAGIQLGAEVTAINGRTMEDALARTTLYTGPFSTDHVRRLNQLVFVTRYPVGTNVAVTFQNPGADTAETAVLRTTFELDSFFAALDDAIPTGFELPLAFELLPDSGFAYVQIYSFSDNDLLTVQLWERLMRNLNDEGTPALIIDMRQNGGGSGFLAASMAAYFFQETFPLGYSALYDEERGEFYHDPEKAGEFFLAPEELRYDGELAVIVGPNCASACEFFSYFLTINDRATVIGHYPTAGLGGSIDRVAMPEGEEFTFTRGRAMDPEGRIHIEGQGVQPTVLVPVTLDSLFGGGDVLLDTAVAQLGGGLQAIVQSGGTLALGDAVTGSLRAGERVRYTLDAKTGDQFSIYLSGETVSGDELDTILNLYDLDGNLLLSSDDLREDTLSSGLEQLEIPYDLTLIIEVATYNDSGSGTYTLFIEIP